MKIIDILNKKANEELEDRFEFKFNDLHFIYFKKVNEIQELENGRNIGSIYDLECCLNDEVEVIEENKEIEKFKTEYTMRQMDIQFQNKINELVQAVNKLNKESEEK